MKIIAIEMVIKMSEEELKFFENIFFLGIGEANPNDVNKGILVFEKIEDIINENKKYKKVLEKNSTIKIAGASENEDKYLTVQNILIEFEKYLKQMMNLYKISNQEFYYEIFNGIYAKLQELKGDKV